MVRCKGGEQMFATVIFEGEVSGGGIIVRTQCPTLASLGLASRGCPIFLRSPGPSAPGEESKTHARSWMCRTFRT